LNDKEQSIDKFNKEMGSLCFSIPNDISVLSFRSLIPFFIRPKREFYIDCKIPGKSGTDYHILLKNAFLLGLDITLVQKKFEIKKEQDRIKQLENNFKNDSLLRDFFTGNKDVSLTLVDLDDRIKRLDDDLNAFKVAEDYYEVQKEADKVEKEAFTLNNKIIMLQNNIDNIDKSLTITPDMNKESVRAVYNESQIHFPDALVKTLNNLEGFYENLISNRKKRLLEQQNKLKLEIAEKKEGAEKLRAKLDKLLQYLGEHRAIDLFIKLGNESAELKMERDNLKKYQTLQASYKTKQRQTEKERILLNENTDQYLSKIESETTALRDYFRTLAKIFYPKSIVGLTIETNEGENQLQFTIDPKIESDDSDGINHVKIFCYDLTILFKGQNHKINFIFHDSRLFDGTDERQKTEMFRIMNRYFSKSGKQYIATVNQNQLEEIKKHLSEAEVEEIITRNTILYLTDDAESGKLLGTTIDLSEKR